MPKRELRHFEYRCDGVTKYGAKCVETLVVEAYDDRDADYRATQVRSEWSGLRWTNCHLGWLCNAPHRDDPRLNFYQREAGT